MGTFGPGPAVPAASEPAGAATEGGTGVTPAAPGVGEGSPSGPSPSVAVTGSVAGSAGDEPAGAAVVGWTSSDAPALKVYFETGSAGVSSEFAEKASELVAYLKEHANAQAVISGFNDSTGDPERNAELSKERAEAVQAALVAAGVPQERTVLEKPVDATGTAGTDSASRRVEVVVRQ